MKNLALMAGFDTI